MLTVLFLLLLILCPFERAGSKFPSSIKIPQNNLQISSNWSFIAVIVYGRRALCAGTAFNEKWVITLAHCVHGNLREENLERFGSMGVRLGAAPITYKKIKEVKIKNNVADDEDDELYVPVVDFDELLPVFNVVVHPEYMYKKNPKINTSLDFVGINDLALVKFKKGSMFSMPSLLLNPNFSGWCVAGGWALSVSEEPLVRKIYEFQFYIGNNQQCQPYLDISAEEIPLDMKEGYERNKICSLLSGDVYFYGVEDGDEGGPLICNNKLHGIISHYTKRSNGDYFNFFYELRQFITWIRKKISEVEELDTNRKGNGRPTTAPSTSSITTKPTSRAPIKTFPTTIRQTRGAVHNFGKTRPYWAPQITRNITPTILTYGTTTNDTSWDMFAEINTTTTIETPITEDYLEESEDWDSDITQSTRPTVPGKTTTTRRTTPTRRKFTTTTPTTIKTTPITKDYLEEPSEDWDSDIIQSTTPTIPEKTRTTRRTTPTRRKSTNARWTIAILTTPNTIQTTPITKDYLEEPSEDWEYDVSQSTTPTTPGKTTTTRRTTPTRRKSTTDRWTIATPTTPITIKTTPIAKDYLDEPSEDWDSDVTQSTTLTIPGKTTTTRRTISTRRKSTAARWSPTTPKTINTTPIAKDYLEEPSEDWDSDITESTTPTTLEKTTTTRRTTPTRRKSIPARWTIVTPTTPKTIKTTPITKDYLEEPSEDWAPEIIQSTRTTSRDTKIFTRPTTPTRKKSTTWTTVINRPRSTTSRTTSGTDEPIWTTKLPETGWAPKTSEWTPETTESAESIPETVLTTNQIMPITTTTRRKTEPTVTPKGSKRPIPTHRGITDTPIWTIESSRRTGSTYSSRTESPMWTNIYPRNGPTEGTRKIPDPDPPVQTIYSSINKGTSRRPDEDPVGFTDDIYDDTWYIPTLSTTMNPWYKHWVIRYLMYFVLSMICLFILGFLVALLFIGYRSGFCSGKCIVSNFFRNICQRDSCW